jgi:hypothetical protein
LTSPAATHRAAAIKNMFYLAFLLMPEMLFRFFCIKGITLSSHVAGFLLAKAAFYLPKPTLYPTEESNWE